MIDVEVSLHSSTGGSEQLRLALPHWVVETGQGRDIHVGLLRVDGRNGAILPSGDGIIWGAVKSQKVDSGRSDTSGSIGGSSSAGAPSSSGTAIQWPLAVVTAPTLPALRYNLGQAWLSYRAPRDGRFAEANNPSNILDDGEPRWVPPLLCARCQNARASGLLLRVELSTIGQLELILDLGGVEGHGELDPASLELDGMFMAPWLVEASAQRARYRLPADDADAWRVLASVEGGVPSGSLAFQSGIALDLATARIELGPGVSGNRPNPPRSRELPRFLSPELLESWPNPFREQTTIRYRVPSTLAEAFDFADREPPSGLDLNQLPPFGDHPTVRIRVYNVSGKLVRMLHTADRAAGEYHISWDGNDMHGRPVAAGAYYINVEMGEYQVTRRVLRLRS